MAHSDSDPVDIQRPTTLKPGDNGLWIGGFESMASPCEILMATKDKTLAQQLTDLAAREAWRIEQKFSRYRDDGIIPRINNSQGQPVTVDEETARLLDFAFQCYQISDGRFDITSGVLRRAWRFDGSSNVPEQSQIAPLLHNIGLDKAQWQEPQFTLPAGMEIDFGGIGKEYAVDRTLQLLQQAAIKRLGHDIPLLVNFGGDIAANRSRGEQQPWRIGIEAIERQQQADAVLAFHQGGIATSGDTRRFLIKDGKRYSHILNPQTGWPVAEAPHAVTVLAQTCTQAGILATLAMLQGPDAETFLEQEGVKFWTQR